MLKYLNLYTKTNNYFTIDELQKTLLSSKEYTLISNVYNGKSIIVVTNELMKAIVNKKYESDFINNKLEITKNENYGYLECSNKDDKNKVFYIYSEDDAKNNGIKDTPVKRIKDVFNYAKHILKNKNNSDTENEANTKDESADDTNKKIKIKFAVSDKIFEQLKSLNADEDTINNSAISDNFKIDKNEKVITIVTDKYSINIKNAKDQSDNNAGFINLKDNIANKIFLFNTIENTANVETSSKHVLLSANNLTIDEGTINDILERLPENYEMTNENDNQQETERVQENKPWRKMIREFKDENPKTYELLKGFSDFGFQLLTKSAGQMNPTQPFKSIWNIILKDLDKDKFMDKKFEEAIKNLAKHNTKFIKNYQILLNAFTKNGVIDVKVKEFINSCETNPSKDVRTTFKSLCNILILLLGKNSKYKEMTQFAVSDFSNNTNYGKYLKVLTDYIETTMNSSDFQPIDATNINQFIEKIYNGCMKKDNNLSVQSIVWFISTIYFGISRTEELPKCLLVEIDEQSGINKLSDLKNNDEDIEVKDENTIEYGDYTITTDKNKGDYKLSEKINLSDLMKDDAENITNKLVEKRVKEKYKEIK